MSESSNLLDKKRRGRPAGASKNSYQGQLDAMGKPIVDTRSYAPHSARWELIPHCCTVCMGRLLRRYLGGGRRKKYEYRYACCGATHVRYEDEGLPCWCGKTAGTHGKIFECVINSNMRPELPNEILVREKPVELKPLPAPLTRTVFSTSTDYL